MNRNLSRPNGIRWRAWLPTPGNIIFTVIIGLLLWQVAAAAPGSAPAAAPAVASTAGIPYQGRLANAAGQPLTGTYSMIFRLYAASAGGAPLWEEQWTGPNGVTVSDGLFNVMLGSLIPLPNNVVTGNSSLWLGITVNTDNEMTPRVQLGVVPYTIFALNIADGTVSTGKLVDSAVTSQKIADAAVTSSKIMTAAVGTTALVNGSVTQAKLGSDVSFIPPNGSVTSAKIADGAVTSRKFNPTRGVATAAGSLALTTVYQDIPGTSVTVNLDTPQTLMVAAVFDMRIPSTAYDANGQLNVDGIPAGGAAFVVGEGSGDTHRMNVSQVYMIDLSAGTHTLKLQAKVTTGSGGTVLDHTRFIYWAMAR